MAMACARALLVDTLPESEQEVGNAWSGRMSGIGSIAGFFVSVSPPILSYLDKQVTPPHSSLFI